MRRQPLNSIEEWLHRILLDKPLRLIGQRAPHEIIKEGDKREDQVVNDAD